MLLLQVNFVGVVGLLLVRDALLRAVIVRPVEHLVTLLIVFKDWVNLVARWNAAVQRARVLCTAQGHRFWQLKGLSFKAL